MATNFHCHFEPSVVKATDVPIYKITVAASISPDPMLQYTGRRTACCNPCPENPSPTGSTAPRSSTLATALDATAGFAVASEIHDLQMT
jgi:hypothetical protein